MPKNTPLLSTAVSSPFDFADFDVHVTRKMLKRWAENPLLNLSFEHAEDHMGDVDPAALRFVRLELGSVRAQRLLGEGRTDDLGRADLQLLLEDGDGESHLSVDAPAGCEPMIEWPDGVIDAVQGVLHAVLLGRTPPTDFQLSTSPPALTAAAIVADGWAVGASSVDDPAMEDWWTAGTAIDVDGLQQAIARGESDDAEHSWGLLVDTDGALTLIRPLFEERHRVTFSHDTRELWAVRRYWLAMHVGADGHLDDVGVRFDTDGTFSIEMSEGPTDSLRNVRVRESSYGPVVWMLERFRIEDA